MPGSPSLTAAQPISSSTALPSPVLWQSLKDFPSLQPELRYGLYGPEMHLYLQNFRGRLFDFGETLQSQWVQSRYMLQQDSEVYIKDYKIQVFLQFMTTYHIWKGERLISILAPASGQKSGIPLRCLWGNPRHPYTREGERDMMQYSTGLQLAGCHKWGNQEGSWTTLTSYKTPAKWSYFVPGRISCRSQRHRRHERGARYSDVN